MERLCLTADDVMWFIAFRKAISPPWYYRFLHPDIQHCHLFGYSSKADAWIICEWADNRALIAPVPKQLIDSYIAKLSQEGPILKAIPGIFNGAAPKPLPTCVGIVKHILGYRFRAITAKQLYDALLERGAKPVF